MVKKLICLAIALLPLAQAEAATRRRAATPPPLFPHCTMVTGTAAVTFTRDDGRTLAPTAERLTGIGYTYGLTATDEPDTLMAWHKDDLILSTDSGCSWRVVATIPEAEFPPTLVAAPGGRVYAWSDNRQFLVRHDARGTVKLKSPAVFVGFGVNPGNADHVRAGSDEGAIWESVDGGETWHVLSTLRTDPQIPMFYRFAFDPADLDHVVAGTLGSGTYYTYDGGRVWRKSQGIDRANAFNGVISAAKGEHVWFMALDVATSGRHIYLSKDGGATFSPVVAEGGGVKLINGPTMAAHPRNPNVLYFVFGSYFQGYGTDLFRYDAASDRLSVTHNDHHGIDSIAFAPGDPNVMYLGLEVEAGR